MILSDLFEGTMTMLRNLSPFQDPPMDRSWDLLQYAKRGSARRG